MGNTLTVRHAFVTRFLPRRRMRTPSRLDPHGPIRHRQAKRPPPGGNTMTAHPDEAMAISQRLSKLAEDVDGDTATLGWILTQLHERAFGLFLLILALPCCIPFLYGIPQVVALPLMFVSAQILLGRRVPWLPSRLAARSVASAELRTLADRAGPWLRKIEAVSRPRLGFLTRAPMDR